MTHMDNEPRGPGKPPKYPWRKLAVGESFFAPERTSKHMHGCAYWQKPLKFRCKQVVSKGTTGTRVWRIA